MVKCDFVVVFKILQEKTCKNKLRESIRLKPECSNLYKTALLACAVIVERESKSTLSSGVVIQSCPQTFASLFQRMDTSPDHIVSKGVGIWQ